MEYKSATVTFSDNQKAKSKSSFKSKMEVTIQLSPDQVQNWKHRVPLTKRQFKKLEKHEKDAKGVIIKFYYNQLRENENEGLLKELFEFVENNIPFPKIITPLIRKRGAPLIKYFSCDNRLAK